MILECAPGINGQDIFPMVIVIYVVVQEVRTNHRIC